MEVKVLNERFGDSAEITFVEGPGGMPLGRIQNTHGVAEIALHGGQVISYQPAGQKPVLWISRKAVFAADWSIRGGIPVCWPWFGAHPRDVSESAHGFVRKMEWQPVSAEGSTLVLGVRSTDETLKRWNHVFELEIRVRLGARLCVDLVSKNPGQECYLFGAALHSYFAVSDIGQVSVEGLADCLYVDKLDSEECKVQKGDITISEEVDRIYFGTTADCIINDPGLERRIRIAKQGSHSTVVWNPWSEKAKRMEDFADDEYREMLCVETTCANPVADWVKVEPGEEHHLVAEISVE